MGELATIRWHVWMGTVVFVVDFTENYTFAPQHEIQSEYYFSNQVAIFVHISYCHVEEVVGFSSTDSARTIV
ncbi:hypothetical protein GOP47_0028038 [Adiantum capillus-veneris]|nr:hypothetical protein GOP47_0028038 [Adiantum capillus-veneris]